MTFKGQGANFLITEIGKKDPMTYEGHKDHPKFKKISVTLLSPIACVHPIIIYAIFKEDRVTFRSVCSEQLSDPAGSGAFPLLHRMPQGRQASLHQVPKSREDSPQYLPSTYQAASFRHLLHHFMLSSYLKFTFSIVRLCKICAPTLSSQRVSTVGFALHCRCVPSLNRTDGDSFCQVARSVSYAH